MSRLTVDGIDMATLAKNVETLAATLRKPGRRGANAVTAGRSGVIRTPDKLHEAPSYIWPMWVVGCADDGTIPTGSTAAHEFRQRIDELTALFDKDGVLDVRSTQPDASVRQADCECVAAIDFSTAGVNSIGRFSVELQNLNAYWSDLTDSQEVLQVDEYLMPAFAGATAPIDDAVVTVTGPATNPRVTDYNKPNSYIQYNDALAAGQSISISALDFTVTGGGGLTADLTKLQVVGMAGRIFRLVPDAAEGGYQARLTASATTAATTLTVSGRRKYLVG